MTAFLSSWGSINEGDAGYGGGRASGSCCASLGLFYLDLAWLSSQYSCLFLPATAINSPREATLEGFALHPPTQGKEVSLASALTWGFFRWYMKREFEKKMERGEPPVGFSSGFVVVFTPFFSLMSTGCGAWLWWFGCLSEWWWWWGKYGGVVWKWFSWAPWLCFGMVGTYRNRLKIFGGKWS